MKANWKARNKQYNDRQKGETYELTVIGFRVHIFNLYENIIDFKVVK